MERGAFNDHPVLATSPWKPLFVDYEPPYAWWFDTVDMFRRLMLTCGTLLVTQIGAFTLMNFAVCCTALCINEQLAPYEDDFDDMLASAERWQTLLLTILFVLGDADMFANRLQFELAGLLLVCVSIFMFMLIFWNMAPSREDLWSGRFFWRKLRGFKKRLKRTFAKLRLIKHAYKLMRERQRAARRRAAALFRGESASTPSPTPKHDVVPTEPQLTPALFSEVLTEDEDTGSFKGALLLRPPSVAQASSPKSARSLALSYGERSASVREFQGMSGSVEFLDAVSADVEAGELGEPAEPELHSTAATSVTLRGSLSSSSLEL